MKDNISVICCFNNKEMYQNALLESLYKQSFQVEIIGVDNTESQFSSAASALNYGASLAHSKYLVFIHQDVVIEDPLYFEKLYDYFDSYPHSLLGVAGVAEDGVIYTNLVQGHDRSPAGKVFQSVKEGQSLDEVMIGIEANLFYQFKFDEKTCNHWHLYAVDLGYTLKEKGFKSYIIPLSFYHLSSGTLSKDYAFSLYKVIGKHRPFISRIETTCSSTKTDWIRSTKYILGLIWDHEFKR